MIDPAVRRQVEQFVRPLYAGLDGVQTFGQVERLRTRIAAIQGGTAIAWARWLREAGSISS